MGIPERREWSTRTSKDRLDSATRAALLEAAEELFAEQGADRTPIAAIAARAGVSRATFYVYFASRQEVFHALAQRVRDDIAQVQREAGRGSRDPRAIVETSIRTALAVYARESRLLTVIRHQALRDAEARELWGELLGAPTRINTRFLERLRRTHGITPAASDGAVAEIVTASLLHQAARIATGAESLDRAAEDLVAAYLRLAGMDALDRPGTTGTTAPAARGH